MNAGLEVRGVPAAFIFDFDGVIVDTAAAKLAAFESLYPKTPEIAEYLESTQGKPRRERFRWINERILDVPYDDAIGDALDSQLSLILAPILEEAPLIAGVGEAVRGMAALAPIFVVSAAPGRDVSKLIRKHSLQHFFEDCFADIGDKALVIDEIVKGLKCLPSQVIFFGDTSSDYRAAQQSGVRFVAVTSRSIELGCDCVSIPDFQDYDSPSKLIRALLDHSR